MAKNGEIAQKSPDIFVIQKISGLNISFLRFSDCEIESEGNYGKNKKHNERGCVAAC